VNIGRRYIQPPQNRDMHDTEVEVFIQEVARALEEEMHHIKAQMEIRCEQIIDDKLEAMKKVIQDILTEKGYEISIEELDQIFRERVPVSMPF